MTQQFKHKTSGELYHIGKDQKQGTNLINSITGSEYFLPGYYEQKDVDELFTPVKETEPEQPYYKGKGEHSVNQLEAICSQYKEYVSFLNSRGNDTTPTSKEGLTYKVECLDNSTAHYTHDKKEAYEVYAKFIIDFGDTIRLYEAPMPINDHDAPEWETIDCFDADEEDMQEHTKGELKCFKNGLSKTGEYCLEINEGNILIGRVIGEEVEPQQIVANAERIAMCWNGWDKVNKERDELKNVLLAYKNMVGNTGYSIAKEQAKDLYAISTELLNRIKP